MSRDDKQRELEDRVAQQRQEVEVRLARLRESMRRETGLAPQRRGWLLALLAGSAGLAAALRLRQRRKKKPIGESRRRRVSPPRDV